MTAFWSQLVANIRAATPLEAFAAITALISVGLCIPAKLNTWAWGIVSVIAYGVVYQRATLYANAWLQIAYFLPISIYGWRTWLLQGPTHHDDLPITNLDRKSHALCWIAALPICALIVAILKRTDDSSYLWDGATAGLSIVAQYLQTRKWLQNWFMWVVVDIVYVGLCYSQHLYLTALLSLIFTVMAAQGYREWVKLMQAGKPHT